MSKYILFPHISHNLLQEVQGMIRRQTIRSCTSPVLIFPFLSFCAEQRHNIRWALFKDTAQNPLPLLHQTSFNISYPEFLLLEVVLANTRNSTFSEGKKNSGIFQPSFCFLCITATFPAITFSSRAFPNAQHPYLARAAQKKWWEKGCHRNLVLKVSIYLRQQGALLTKW